MGINVHLTVIFKEEAPIEKRGKFIASLRKDDWGRLPETENCWKAIFKTGVTDGAAMNVAKHDLDRASKKADILDYKALIKLDDGPQITLNPFYSDKHLSARANRK